MSLTYQPQNFLTDDAHFIAGTIQIELPEPALIPREISPAHVSQTRSRYSASELATAAAMLKKLNQREDMTNLLAEAELPDHGNPGDVIDVVVERLMLVCDAAPALMESAVEPKFPALKLRR